MTLEIALKTSLQYEAKVRGVYHTAMQEAEDETARKVFGTLEREEQEHIDYLQDRLKELQTSGHITVEKLDTKIPSQAAIAEGISKLSAQVASKRSNREIDLFRAALAVERETSEFYNRMARELDGRGKELFSRFVEIEEGHVSIVQAEIDSLTGSGYWFDFGEFNLSPS